MNKKKFYNRHSQDGAALIVALAMLALLLIMLIGFLASSIIEQRIAYSYRDDLGSKLLVRSALVRARSILAANDRYPDDLLYMRSGAPEVSGKPDIIAPIVSFNKENQSKSSGEPSGNDTAYKALKPLLKRYFGPNKAETVQNIADKWEWKNFLPAGVSMFYPDWIYYYHDPKTAGTNRRITGRMAYVMVPNMGINLSLLEGKTPRIGKEFAELSSESFLTAAGKGKLNKFRNWLSTDILMGKEGLYREESGTTNFNFANADEENFHSGSLGGKMDGANSDWGKEKAFATLFLTADENGYVKNDQKFDITNLSKSGGTVTLFPAYTALADWENFFSSNFDFTAGNAECKQVAANAKDYVDADHLPTTDLASATAWADQTPTFAGNEQTPYINQIVPAFEIKADYTMTSEKKNFLQTTYTQTANFSVRGKIFAELINIYKKAQEEEGIPAKLVIKNLKIKIKISAQIGRVLAGAMIPTKTLPAEDVVLTADTVELPVTSVAAQSYSTFSDDITLSGILPTLESVSDSILGCPTMDITVDLTGVEFDRAVLVNSDNQGLDFVGKLSQEDLPKQFIGRFLTTNPDNNLPAMNTDSAWEFSNSNASSTACLYSNFEVADPRLNLAADQWKKSEWKSSMAAFADDDISGFNYGSKNSDAEAKNDSLAEEKDLEADDDPVKLSTAYIRNAPMQSIRELGLIHRGKPWQTFNLRSTVLDPDLSAGIAMNAKLTYLNDAVILERYLSKLDEITVNVNQPANMSGAFAPLTTGMQYKANQYDTTATPLSAAAQKELRAWLANKCCQAAGDDPADTSSSTRVYNRYVRRSELANVVTDWVLKGKESPLKGNISDAALEELVNQIVPHVRFGEMYEYYTLFAVAQTIKDMDGTIYRYNDEGKLQPSTSTLGGTSLDDNDLITSETFMVARLRRTINCKATGSKYNKSCLWGRHLKGCTKSVRVIECYTFSMD